MAGHSHWAGIKYKKAANDAKRGKMWSKISRMIIVSAKAGGGDPAANLALRYAIDKAKAANMPKDTIEKAIKKGTGELGAVQYEAVLYEGYAPGGVAVMADGLTDNRARTAPEIKKVFERRGGSLGASGCVAWMFSKKGLITVKTDVIAEDDLLELALASGADDMQNTGQVYELTCAAAAYEGLRKSLQDRNIPIEVAEISMVPQSMVPVNDVEIARKILGLMEELEDHDDIQNVYANFDIPDDVLEKAES
ncbi:MAG TPA: YebC/PmpR family DNA-binding transcriptional regulator [Anaerohalosphaeraceae bacterium]|jgi:YebC/PmpR family DNA-binding regulatory protein|nr:YebC/PmpR family DNA-binding transcriptional regulator [Anaerohalosphaeraceae bacterium]HRT51682.1 YebC/PmpR family DNA-binding transcriptional regulator [Anaerohalosphaeraceae bacterium]HRT87359.1 YebC/PmpR family DNA-binding transcriptional regulator [Anaerohalosphaeraceae bacterium]